MKHNIRLIIALVVCAATLLSLAACGAKNNAGKDLMKALFDRLVASEEYAEWKSTFPGETFEESIDGKTVNVSVTGFGETVGDYSFTLDGDYIVCTTDDEDYKAYAFMTELRKAVADYYGMSDALMTGYLAAKTLRDEENDYFIISEEDGSKELKLYVASEWDLSSLDGMYIEASDVESWGALNDEDTNLYVSLGKITAAAFGSAADFDLIVGEYGENTELTYKSVMTIVNELRPAGYEAFTENWKELAEVVENGYSVVFGIPEDVAENVSFPVSDDYKYVTVSFSSDAETEEDEPEEPAPVLADFTGVYTCGRCAVTVTAVDETEAKISVLWANTAAETVEYSMTGSFNPDVLRINYSDGVKTTVVFGSDGERESETVEYTGGLGRLQFDGEGSLLWQDEQEAENLIDMTFTRVG